MGITPLSTAISTRGKFVEGNTDTRIVKAREAPRRPRVRIRKITGLECRAIQWSVFGWFTQSLRRDYFSLLPPLGALESSPLAPSPLAPSAGASAGAASTLILVLSGNP